MTASHLFQTCAELIGTIDASLKHMLQTLRNKFDSHLFSD